MQQLALTTISFTEAELAEIKRRQRESEKLIAQLAATETLEEQERLADELCPAFDAWVRGRNRIQSTPARAPRTVAIIRPRTREHAPRATRRTASSSTTSSSDPGDPEGLRHISIPIADELKRIADRLRAKGGVG